MKNILTANGYTVVGEAKNGKIGVVKYIELNPDIVTMDVTMAEMNGVEALQQIKKYDPMANVVMVSAMGQEIIVKDAIMNGAKGFILKPFDEKQIVDALRKL